MSSLMIRLYVGHMVELNFPWIAMQGLQGWFLIHSIVNNPKQEDRPTVHIDLTWS